MISPRDAWHALVVRFANGRPLCNCRDAYYATDGKGYRGGERVADLHHCKDGCSANILTTRDEIAQRVIGLLP